MPLNELADALVEGDIKTKRLGVIAKEESFEKLYNSVSMTVTNYENKTSKRIQLQCKRRHEQVITGDCIIDYVEYFNIPELEVSRLGLSRLCNQVGMRW